MAQNYKRTRNIHCRLNMKFFDKSQEVLWRYLNGLSFLKGLDADGYLTPLQILQTCKYQLRRLACSFPWLWLFDQISLSFEAFVVSILVARNHRPYELSCIDVQNQRLQNIASLYDRLVVHFLKIFPWSTAMNRLRRKYTSNLCAVWPKDAKVFIFQH